MEGSTIVWIIIGIIVVGGIIAFAMTRSGGRRAEAERAQAAEIREQATEHDRRLRESEASAAEAKARSELARAEAQKRELEAERLAAEAEHQSDRAADVRRERDEQLRLADLRDPDVRTDKEGYRIDEHGKRIGGGVATHDDTGHLEHADVPVEHANVPVEHRGDVPVEHRGDVPVEHQGDMPVEHRADLEDRADGHEHRPGVLDRGRDDVDGDGRVDADEEGRADGPDEPGRRGSQHRSP